MKRFCRAMSQHDLHGHLVHLKGNPFPSFLYIFSIGGKIH
jgi:hypothetical protein